MTNDNIKVSICCITYNHEKYIEQALKSFLEQKVDFKYEILIHDDCSSDKTSDIIRRYERLYPDIIKPIYQSVNQYSIGITNVTQRYNFPRARGKYIAICEGDDYWTDNKKLQKQVDILDSDPNISLCFHAAKALAMDSSYPETNIRPYKNDRFLSAAEVIDKTSAYPTASLMFPSKHIKELPDFFATAPVMDIPLQIILASKGLSFYIDSYMSVYRVGVSGSWTKDLQKGDFIKKQHKYFKEIKATYEAFDSYTDYAYSPFVKNSINRIYFLILVNTKNYKKVLSKKYKHFFAELSPRTRFYIKFEFYFPLIYKLIRNLALSFKS